MTADTVRILHCADIHLDSPLRGLAAHDGAPVDDLRNAARRAFVKVVDHCLDDGIALMLIAGDLFDGDWRDFQTGLFFAGQMARLRDAGVRVVVVRGNHDAESTLTRSLPLPDSVHVLSGRAPETLCFDDLGVAVQGQSFAKAKTLENLAEGYPPPVAGMVNIGLLHTAVAGYEGHDTYAPCTLTQLIGHGYDYWALGHVHQHLILNVDPWVVFPGNLQGRHARETGAKGVVAVTITNGAITDVSHLPMDVLRWQAAAVDVGGAETPLDALDAVRATLDDLMAARDGRPLAVRLTLTGACTAHAALLAAGADWRHQVDALALDVGGGDLWVEKVRLRTRPAVDRAALAEGAAPIASLLRTIESFAADDDARRALDDDIRQVTQKLPSGSRFKRGLDDALLAELLAAAEGRILGDIGTGEEP